MVAAADCTRRLIMILLILSEHSRESCDFRILKTGRFLSKSHDSGKTFFDISVSTNQIGMGFEADTAEK